MPSTNDDIISTPGYPRTKAGMESLVGKLIRCGWINRRSNAEHSRLIGVVAQVETFGSDGHRDWEACLYLVTADGSRCHYWINADHDHVVVVHDGQP